MLPQPIPEPPGPIDWHEAASLYVDEGLSYAEVARRMGRTRDAVRRVLLAHGVPPRRPRPMKHRKWAERLYAIWQDMKKRCLRPEAKSYRNYGARGWATARNGKRSSPSIRGLWRRATSLGGASSS